MSAEDIVLQFMHEQNRPYNVQNVVDHMQKYGIKKPTVQKTLEGLVEKGKLAVQIQNKTSVYHINQANLNVPSPEELAQAEQQVKELQQRITDGQQSLAAEERELCELEKQQTAEQIATRMEELMGQCEALEAQLAPLRGATNLVSKEDLKKTEKRFEAVFGEYRKRKRMFKCVFDQVLESSEKKPKILQDEIGIETDESAGLDCTKLQAMFDGMVKAKSGRR